MDQKIQISAFNDLKNRIDLIHRRGLFVQTYQWPASSSSSLHLPKELFERRFSPMDRSLRRELKSTFGSDNYWFNTVNYLH